MLAMVFLLGFLCGTYDSQRGLVLEILVLRQQLAVLHRAHRRVQLRALDRAFWVILSRCWSRWAYALVLVKPETVIGWHHKGFALFWRWKSRRPVGRPPTSPELIALIRRMAEENPLWRRRRIASELRKLGYDVDKDTVAKYMPKPAPPTHRGRSQTWKTSLAIISRAPSRSTSSPSPV